MKLCALGFILIVAALVGFSGMLAYDDQYWKIALASQQSLSDSPPPQKPPGFSRSELAFDAMGLAGITLIVIGTVQHLRRTNAAGISK